MKREYRNIVFGYCGMMAVCVAAGMWIGMKAAVFAMIMASMLLVITLAELRRRNQRIAILCDKVDRMLYEDIPWEIDSYEEGELSVLEDKVQKLTIRLREQDAMLRQEKELQEQMMTNISHQLKTPLTSINLILSGLRRETGKGQPASFAALNELGQLVEQVDSLVVTLLKIAKMDSGTALFEKKCVVVEQLVKRAAKPLAISMDLHEIVLVTEGDRDISYMGDMNWSSEALTNILKNAMEHMPQGGKIKVFWSENSLYTQIVIEDQGSGMEEEELAHIFERFYRGTKARHAGFGIGMSFARMVIVRQNGTIQAENRREGGMRFTIRLYKE